MCNSEAKRRLTKEEKKEEERVNAQRKSELVSLKARSKLVED